MYGPYSSLVQNLHLQISPPLSTCTSRIATDVPSALSASPSASTARCVYVAFATGSAGSPVAAGRIASASSPLVFTPPGPV
jgi:hypothetical protein